MTIKKTCDVDGIAAILEKRLAGERLSRDDGLHLLASDDIIALGSAAHAVKRRHSGERVFFNVNCHLNLTNICAARCPLCAFSCDAHDPRAYCMDQQEAVARVRAAGAGVTEIHMVSGLHPEKPFSYYLDIVSFRICILKLLPQPRSIILHRSPPLASKVCSAACTTPGWALCRVAGPRF
jgi:2-iminoacetate synthase ThiH